MSTVKTVDNILSIAINVLSTLEEARKIIIGESGATIETKAEIDSLQNTLEKFINL